MASSITLAFGFGTILLVLASVLGAVERRERFAYVLGVDLIVVGLSLAPVANAPGSLVAAVFLVGFVAVLAAVVPLLRE